MSTTLDKHYQAIAETIDDPFNLAQVYLIKTCETLCNADQYNWRVPVHLRDTIKDLASQLADAIDEAERFAHWKPITSYKAR